MNPQYDLKGRRAVVTGGSKGIGRAIAEALAAAGATVQIWDLEPPAASDLAEGFLSPQRADVTDPHSLRQARDAMVEEAGGCDILIANAGFVGAPSPVETFDAGLWRQIIEVNLTGVFHSCQALIPDLKAGGWGRIVAISSLAGKEGTPNAAAYSASKAGVIALIKSLGKELAGSGVLANAIAPTVVETDLIKQVDPAHLQIMIDKSPFKRMAQVEEVAALALWLSSEACSFSSGAVFDLSGARATY